MDEAANPKWLDRQRRILAAGAGQAGGTSVEGVAAEESVAGDAAMPHPDDVLARVANVAEQMPAREVGDPDDFKKALETIYRFGRPGLANLASGAAVSADQAVALEAIIEADGSRPSFLLENGLPPLQHPFLGTWSGPMLAAREAMRKVAEAVGRVQPTDGNASKYIGTATLFQTDPPRALTNYHVLDDAKKKQGIAVDITGNVATVGPGLEVDFVGEAASLNTNRFKVLKADLPQNFGRGFGHVDAAVLHLEPRNDAQLPEPFANFSALASYATGGAASLCTIGFPGPPDIASSGEINWNWVISTLFNDLFGYKRLAPGRFLEGLGSHPSDSLKLVLSHDATTFGGASGSLVLAWAGQGEPSFGLHFAGRTGKANYMISMAKAAQALRAVGVPIP